MKKFVCMVCGYTHEGDYLPEDFVCPICKHGAIDFELQESEVKEDNTKQKKLYCPYCGNLENYIEGQDTCKICKQKMQVVEID